jgi:glycosyltransferase involved in cell wall biosynthesis
MVIAPTPFFGDRGCHVRIYEEVRALSALGVATEVITYPAGEDPAGFTVRRSPRIPGIRIRPVGPGYTRPILDAALFGTALAAARAFRPDIVHAHLHEGIAIGAMLRRRLGAPLIADLQGSLAGELIDHGFLSSGSLSAGFVGRLERWLVAKPDVLLASSTASARLLEAQGVDPARVVWLPDGVDLLRFRRMPADEGLRDSLGLAGKEVVVFLGLLTPYQGVDLLLDSVSEVVKAVPAAHFLVMGYPNEERYRAIAAARGLGAAVTLTGRIRYDEAPRYLSLGSVAVSPKLSATEANGKLLNYMACALPTVATDTIVNRELLGEAGVYVPLHDAAALAQAVVGLLRDPGRREATGRALRQRAEEMFAWPVLGARLLEIYRAAKTADRTGGHAARP